MIKPLTPLNVSEVADIHLKALEGDFLPSLGFDFLKTFYSGIVGKKAVYSFGIFEEDKLQGFVIGTTDSKKFFSDAFKENIFKLIILLLFELFKKPTLLKNILETLLYPNKTSGPKAELVVIAIRKNFQGKGAGKSLVGILEREFKRNGIKRYKLTVHADKGAVGFYEHLKYQRTSSFQLYGKMWYQYEKKLPQKYK